jgi:hypothetical protein
MQEQACWGTGLHALDARFSATVARLRLRSSARLVGSRFPCVVHRDARLGQGRMDSATGQGSESAGSWHASVVSRLRHLSSRGARAADNPPASCLWRWDRGPLHLPGAQGDLARQEPSRVETANWGSAAPRVAARGRLNHRDGIRRQSPEEDRWPPPPCRRAVRVPSGDPVGMPVLQAMELPPRPATQDTSGGGQKTTSGFHALAQCGSAENSGTADGRPISSLVGLTPDACVEQPVPVLPHTSPQPKEEPCVLA